MRKGKTEKKYKQKDTGLKNKPGKKQLIQDAKNNLVKIKF